MRFTNSLNNCNLQKQHILLLCCLAVTLLVNAQSNPKGDIHGTASTAVIRIEGNQNGWVKGENESSTGSNSPTTVTENVSFSSTPDGIYVTINSGTNKIKLFALTGQLLLDGDLNQGRFFIPTRKGIYFLKINNKSYKVICK